MDSDELVVINDLENLIFSSLSSYACLVTCFCQPGSGHAGLDNAGLNNAGHDNAGHDSAVRDH